MKLKLNILILSFLSFTNVQNSNAKWVDSALSMANLAAFNTAHSDTERYFEVIIDKFKGRDSLGDRCIENFSAYNADLAESRRLLNQIAPLASEFFQDSINRENLDKLKEYTSEFKSVSSKFAKTVSKNPLKLRESGECRTVTETDKQLTTMVFWNPLVEKLSVLNRFLQSKVK